ncbi:MAG: hypothetical protein ACQEQV_10490 [Fibrobacterota bacterium]
MKRIILLILAGAVYLGAEEFLSQDYIDTTIQKAYYKFIAANSASGGRSSQKQAIEEAKATVERLKKQAETDPNYRYILWKVNELEAQIALEEEEYDIQNAYKRGLQINEMVKKFNRELDKERPSFGKLHGFHKSMMKLDVSKANEFADLINHHHRYIRQQVQDDIQDAFRRGDYEKAEDLFGYAIKSRRYLGISERQYSQWRQKITDKKTADFLRKNLDERISNAADLLGETKNIMKSRRIVQVLLSDLENASDLLDYSFVSRARRNLKQNLARINHVEDSLVQYNLSLIDGHNTDRAARYLERVLQNAGISSEKIAQVDRAILQASRQTVDRGTAAKVRGHMADINRNENSVGLLSMSDIKTTLKRKKDSIAGSLTRMEDIADDHYYDQRRREVRSFRDHREDSLDEHEDADEDLQDIRDYMDRGRYRWAQRRFDRKREDLLRYGTPKKCYFVIVKLDEHGRMDGDVNHMVERMRRRMKQESDSARKENASHVIGEIYTAVEDDRLLDAYGLYYRNRLFLKEYAYGEAYSSMRVYLLKKYSKEYDLHDA